MMPQGMGRRFRKMISGLLFLSVVIMSAAQAHATVLQVMHDAVHPTAAAHHDVIADAQLSLSGHDHTGLPCAGHDGAHGLTCCCFGCGCPMMSGWLPVPATGLPAIVATTFGYLDASTARPDDLRFAPALPPPRPIV
jgi:hypothetical protein